VYPSAVELLTKIAAVAFPAPGRFSTATGILINSDMLYAKLLAMKSGLPPGTDPTTVLIELKGYS
jgi:hypothetical protein